MPPLPEPLTEISLSSSARTFGHWLPRTYNREGDGRDPFDLNAPYQRGSVWTAEQRRALIKSLYIGLPIGTVIVSVLPYRQGCPYSYRIVDGKQRIETIRAFVNDEFTVPGHWFRPEHGGPYSGEVCWSDLNEVAHRKFDMGTSVPALEFHPDREWLGRDPAGRTQWRER